MSSYEEWQRRCREIDEQMRPVNERARELAVEVVSTLDGASAEMLFAFAEGLRLAERPASVFASPVLSLAIDRERDQPAGFLALLLMTGALQEAALDGDLLHRLENAETGFGGRSWTR